SALPRRRALHLWASPATTGSRCSPIPNASRDIGERAPTDLTALLLSRIQFGSTIAFHIIFPSFTIGLAAGLTSCGVILWGVFPIVYATLFSAFYLPLLLMLAGLILRGVAFEYRNKTERLR